MDYAKKKAKQKCLYNKPDILSDKQTVKNKKKEISKYNRVIEKQIIDSEYEDYVLNEEDENWYLKEYYYDDIYYEESLIWSDIDLDNLPIGVTLDEDKCDGINCEERYSEKYDAEYCRACDKWLVSTCINDDDSCEFCANRPIRPSEAISGL